MAWTNIIGNEKKKIERQKKYKKNKKIEYFWNRNF